MVRTLVAVLGTMATVVALVVPATPAAASPAAAPTTSDHTDHEGCDAAAATSAVPVSAPSAAAPAALAQLVGLGSCSGVRPGAQLHVPGEGSCTVGFLFRGDRPDGSFRSYASTAAHCVLGTNASTQERTWADGRGPIATDADGNRIGRFVYAVVNPLRDFALVRLDLGVGFDPSVCTFGGPTGVNDDLTNSTVMLRHHGQGVGTGAALPGRTAIARGTPHRHRVFADGLASFGDSGSPVLSSDGRALGLVVTTGVHFGGEYLAPESGTVGISRIGPAMRRAGDVLGENLRMRRADS